MQPRRSVAWTRGPLDEVIVLAEPRALLSMGRAGMMVAEHRIHTVPWEEHEVRKGAEMAIPQHHIARHQQGAQGVEEPLFMCVE
jgi:hypothetical protein